jgi:hypothetical protein
MSKSRKKKLHVIAHATVSELTTYLKHELVSVSKCKTYLYVSSTWCINLSDIFFNGVFIFLIILSRVKHTYLVYQIQTCTHSTCSTYKDIFNISWFFYFFLNFIIFFSLFWFLKFFNSFSIYVLHKYGHDTHAKCITRLKKIFEFKFLKF